MSEASGADHPPVIDAIRDVAMHDVLFVEHELHEVLSLVAKAARTTLRHIDGASVSLRKGGRTVTTSATDDVSSELDRMQDRFNEGPCVDAVRLGRPVTVALEDEPQRYPAFGALALQRFITGVLSLPLIVHERTTGALNLYSATAASFDEHEVVVASLFAHEASMVLANAGSYADANARCANLEVALASRELIGQAMGILMERERCSSDEAFDRLRQRSQQANRKLVTIADEVVRSVR